MQTAYTLSTLETETKPGEPVKLLQNHFEQSKDLLVYVTYFLAEVAGYAETDSYNRSNKHLPTKEDLNVNTKIAGNEILWKIKENPSYQQALGKCKPDQTIDKELVKRSITIWSTQRSTRNTPASMTEASFRNGKFWNLFSMT